MYWTIKQNWDGKLWPRLWPNKSSAWEGVERETGKKRKWIEENCDWSLVQVELNEVKANTPGFTGRAAVWWNDELGDDVTTEKEK